MSQEEFEFASVSGPKKYFKYKECESGDVLVEKGEYMGSGTDKFGNPNHNFKELDSDVVKCLNSAGGLNYAVENHLVEGDVCRVVYKGKTTLETGKFEGKDCHTFDVQKAKSTKVPTSSKISLDDLE